MECKHCKGAINDEHLFCPFCGEKIEKEEVKEVKQEAVESSSDAQEEAKEVKEASTSPVAEEAPAEKPKNNNRFTVLLFSIMFVFSILAVSMALEQKNEIRILEHNLHTLAKQVVQLKAPIAVDDASGITGEKTEVNQIGRFTDGEVNLFVLNVQVPEGVFFNGTPLSKLTPEQETAFADALLKDSWKSVSEDSHVCYPNLHIELMVNNEPYAVYDGKSVSLR